MATTRFGTKLHMASDSEKWPNVLLICELLFSLPFSNGHIERMFSSLKVMKTDRRTNLTNSTLQDLLEIGIEGPTLDSFSADQAVQLWWEDCRTSRRVNQRQRKEYQQRTQPESDSSGEELTTEDWDRWFRPLSPEEVVEPDSDISDTQ